MLRGPRRRLAWATGAAALVGVLILAGPRVRFEDRWTEPTLPVDLDAYLERSEGDVPDLRPGDARSVVWLDPEAPAVTPWALVYLHGFSADRHEVEPLVTELASDLGANVYFARLTGHGRDGAAMAEASVEDWLDDTAEAVAIGGFIGQRVVLVGTSTGGTLALWAAAREESQDRIDALVLISPNLGLRDPTARLLLWPWGGAMARVIVGPERCFQPKNAEHERHWTTCYPTRALLPMMALVDRVRSLEPGAVTVPTFVAYSRDDEVVDPAETDRVMAHLAARPPDFYVVEGSTDPEHHVIAGAITSPETTESVRRRILDFLAPLR
jgi:alpha-beta hydrolase superfamily lysophospholipase